jgi:hypothetical protein
MVTRSRSIGWTWLRRTGKYNPLVRKLSHGFSGVYAFRVWNAREGHYETLYVGSSHTDRLWKTAIRHVQDCTGRFYDRGEWTWQPAEELEIKILVTTPSAAINTETEWAARLRPTKRQKWMTCSELDAYNAREAAKAAKAAAKDDDEEIPF